MTFISVNGNTIKITSTHSGRHHDIQTPTEHIELKKTSATGTQWKIKNVDTGQSIYVYETGEDDPPLWNSNSINQAWWDEFIDFYEYLDSQSSYFHATGYVSLIPKESVDSEQQCLFERDSCNGWDVTFMFGSVALAGATCAGSLGTACAGAALGAAIMTESYWSNCQCVPYEIPVEDYDPDPPPSNGSGPSDGDEPGCQSGANTCSNYTGVGSNFGSLVCQEGYDFYSNGIYQFSVCTKWVQLSP